jgi:DNA-binding GntR family transcriptional regulator
MKEAAKRGAPEKRRAPLDGSALDDSVHAEIVKALMEGRLTPGAKMPEHRLARIFGVSRERVRKALHRLVAERRLEAIPQRGVFVPNPSAQDIRTVYQAHRVFEAGVLAHLAQSADAETFSRLEAHLVEERRAAEGRDRAASVRLSGEFHMMLVDALGNEELSRFLRELLLRSSLMVSAFEPARLSPCGVDEHEAIAKALSARDAEAAIALSSEHFSHIEERLAVGAQERADENIEDVFGAPAPAGRGEG